MIGLDAGHGGARHGAQNTDGDLREHVLTLDVASGAWRKLRLDGLDPKMIRKDDIEMTLDERAQTARRMRCDAVVSIHFNWSPDPSRQGGEVYHHPNDARGRQLGVEILNAVPEPYHWRVWNSDYRVNGELASPGAWAVTSAYAAERLPCALVELAFLSSPHDVDWLRSAGIVDMLGWALAVGIERWRMT